MHEPLSLLSQGLQIAGRTRTAHSLGDRSKYIGLSDVGKAADCLRAAVADKLGMVAASSSQSLSSQQNHTALLRELRMQRGHWFENGVAEAFRAAAVPVLHQISIHTRHHSVPIVAHLDFVLISMGETPHIQIVELKSTEQIPDIAYAAHEVQLAGQIGLLESLWNQPCFMVQPGPLHTFPDLVRHTCNISLPKQSGNAVIEGSILMLSMNDAKEFGPYRPNRIMLDVCLDLAEQVWTSTEQARGGTLDFNQIPTANGFHPLCDYCEWNADCPKFHDGEYQPEWQADLERLAALKQGRNQLEAEIGSLETGLKDAYARSGMAGDWINTGGQRFRVTSSNGRRTLSRERLRQALTLARGEEKADDLLARCEQESRAFSRLVISEIN